MAKRIKTIYDRSTDAHNDLVSASNQACELISDLQMELLKATQEVGSLKANNSLLKRDVEILSGKLKEQQALAVDLNKEKS